MLNPPAIVIREVVEKRSYNGGLQTRVPPSVYVNLCWAKGQFLASGVLRGMLQYDSECTKQVQATLAQLRHTIQLESGIQSDSSYRDCYGLCRDVRFVDRSCFPTLGRRTLYAGGIAAASASLLVVGILSAAAARVNASIRTHSIYSMTVGPICYAIISETLAVRLRPQTVVNARSPYAVTQILANVLNHYILNPIEWNRH
ncbi:hypothetical protein SODALDRAFT_322973 [Sodiomyces alkalinus F11]|uniref:Uncharacterized protein n=1 Tax=Sodiomyces alkalinus (strain CBS 110278 / VKM F-3762 / F11) TaxID=1314773 RepID=A0A3N2PYI9_SODAK|nr:hypothetical protein SODALDRAFT_322973 [Sodiomyces alkalinus F11]ROT39601.1 hypothetical protein SODALDRAFT_322973 [Sodiomyces alkalinus F11]